MAQAIFYTIFSIFAVYGIYIAAREVILFICRKAERRDMDAEIYDNCSQEYDAQENENSSEEYREADETADEDYTDKTADENSENEEPDAPSSNDDKDDELFPT